MEQDGRTWAGGSRKGISGTEETKLLRGPCGNISDIPALLEPRGWAGNEPEGWLEHHIGP